MFNTMQVQEQAQTKLNDLRREARVARERRDAASVRPLNALWAWWRRRAERPADLPAPPAPLDALPRT